MDGDQKKKDGDKSWIAGLSLAEIAEKFGEPLPAPSAHPFSHIYGENNPA